MPASLRASRMADGLNATLVQTEIAAVDLLLNLPAWDPFKERPVGSFGAGEPQGGKLGAH